ncbi:hypothetical protein FSPOR_2021 [Fusarium sporotrichioides]|uniref:DUF6546 domain-containing protein n=1 Tax=Fusarium sporotrichioides TaxID=5514 RepID=A0A395SMX4_FUSSP|nr:hypothetical protein FSPOR_2021 [Fusarium sporotrichioides]
MPRFYSLPAEIQNMILHLVAEPSTTSSTPHTTSSLPAKPHLAPYVCVDKFWNSFFESRTFNNLTITQDDIPALAHIVGCQRRPLLKHLWLRIELPKYLTPPTKQDEKPKVLWKVDSVFTMSISSLWDVLSEWDSTGQEGMTLELSAFSPSDWVGFLLYDCSVEKDAELYKKYLASGSTEQYEAAGDVHKPYISLHGALGTGSGELTTKERDQYWLATINNLLGWKPLDFFDNAAELPPVSVVTKFLIRRQQFREIYPTALNKMLGSFSAVQDIHIERWRCAELRDEKAWCKEAQITFGMDLPPSVKRLSLYGDMSKVFHTWEARETTVVSLAKTLRQYTRDLEYLSISHLIDAKEFLRPFWSASSEKATRSLPDWKNLKRLSLTSDIFKTGTKKDITNLLCAAARAAKKMPSLEMLELWNGGKERACVFCYRVEDTVGEITWRGTHLPALDNEVVRAWAVASINNDRPDVRESSEPIKAEDVASARQVLKYLASKDQVMHSVSACRAIGKRNRNDSDEDEMKGSKRTRNDIN